MPSPHHPANDMPFNIPLEDSFTDIIGKAQRGLSINDEMLVSRSGATPSEICRLKSGEVDEAVIQKVAAVLGLGADALLALAKSSYKPASVQEPEGLAIFNTVFEDMTVNSFLVWDPATKEAAFFDTGADGRPMLDFATSSGLKVRQIFITHIHSDHILDLDRLVKGTGAQVWVCEKEPMAGAEPFSPGRVFQIGGLVVESRLTSGHAAGGVTYFIQGLSQPVAIVGDSMFAGSMGGGMVSYADALRNNREQILTLPDATIICSGHGPLTTVGEQKHANPFFTA
jgi:hydroxyacylglutathione hydrolase